MNNEINDLILTPAELDKNAIDKILFQLNRSNIDYYDLYFQYSKNEFYAIEDGQVKNTSFNIDNGCGVRAISDEKTAYAYTDEVNFRTLIQSCEIVNALKSQGQEKKIPVISSQTKHMLYQPIDPVINTGKQKIEILKKIESMAFAVDPRIKKVNASIAAEYDAILIVNQQSEFKTDIRPLVRLSLSIIVEHKGRREQGTAGGGGRFSIDYFNDQILKDYVDEAYHQAITNLDATPSPAGLMTVVLGPGWPGILLHEAVGHGLEGDFNRKKTSAFSDRIGERVASPGVTVIDDGTLPDRRGSLTIDDEGTPTEKTVLIEDGILKGYMQDRMNARLMGMAATGNGRRESFACQPMPRMTNTYMLGGDKEPEEILASVKDGIYATSFGGGQVDITSGKFVFSCTEAYEIKNGKLGAPLKGATLIGTGPESMQRISMIGNDMQLDEGIGTCGKAGQGVPVGVGQPTLRLEGL